MAAAGLMKAIANTHQFMAFPTPPNLQWGAATGLRLDDDYFSTLAADMQRKRDRLGNALADIGFEVLPAHGTYFVTTDFRPLGFNGTHEGFSPPTPAQPTLPPTPAPLPPESTGAACAESGPSS